MEQLDKNRNTLNRLTCAFIILGIIEIIVIIYLKYIIVGIGVGLLTIITAFISLNEKYIKLKYFVGLWTIIKYNPFFGLAQIAYLFCDFSKNNNMPKSLFLFSIIFMIASLVLGIIIIITTMKYRKSLKNKNIYT